MTSDLARISSLATAIAATRMLIFIIDQLEDLAQSYHYHKATTMYYAIGAYKSYNNTKYTEEIGVHCKTVILK